MNDAERRLISTLEAQAQRLVFTHSDNADTSQPGSAIAAARRPAPRLRGTRGSSARSTSWTGALRFIPRRRVRSSRVLRQLHVRRRRETFRPSAADGRDQARFQDDAVLAGGEQGDSSARSASGLLGPHSEPRASQRPGTRSMHGTAMPPESGIETLVRPVGKRRRRRAGSARASNVAFRGITPDLTTAIRASANRESMPGGSEPWLEGQIFFWDADPQAARRATATHRR